MLNSTNRMFLHGESGIRDAAIIRQLRFYEDKAVGYKYPDLYRVLFGEDYKPEPYIEAAYPDGSQP